MEKKITIQMNRRLENYDSTSKDMRVSFPDEQDVLGHKFHHVAYGIYAADEPFVINRNEMSQKLEKNRESGMFLCGKGTKRFNSDLIKVYFGYMGTGNHSLPELNFIEDRIRNGDSRFTLFPDYLVRDEALSGDSDWFIDQERFDSPDSEKRLFIPDNANVGSIYDPKPMIQIMGNIGFEVEQGIWMFTRVRPEEADFFSEEPNININSYVKSVDVAIIGQSGGFGLSCDAYIKYLAIGEEAIGRLRKKQLDMGEGFFHRLRRVESEDIEEMKQGPRALDLSIVEELFDEAAEESGSISDDYVYPDTAEPIIPGLGTDDIELCLSTPFHGDGRFKEYKKAYIDGNELVLVNYYDVWNPGKPTEIRRKLALLDGLYVKAEKKLACGVKVPTTYKVIDCKEEKLRELLTDEAYKLYCEDRAGGGEKDEATD